MLQVPARPSAPVRTQDADQLLSVTTVRDGSPGRAVVEVVGEVDAYTAPVLDACLRSQPGHPGIREVVVDLSDVRFLDAAGIHVLARADRRCRMRGARLVILTGGRRTALRPLQSAGLTDPEAVDPPRPAATRRGRRDAHSAASDPASSVGERSAPTLTLPVRPRHGLDPGRAAR